jgi:hypothetical protein
MTHILHHFRRNRSYSSHERWGVFAALLLLTLVVSAGGGLMFGRTAASAMPIAVQINLERDTLPVGLEPAGQVALTLTNKETMLPAANVWVGLRIADPALRTPAFTYYDWYSPKPEHAFFITDTDGQVKFPLASLQEGAVEYQIYTANPESASDAKYQSLHSSFVVSYEQ